MAKYRSENNIKAKYSTVSAAMVLSIAISLPLSALLFFGHNWFDFLFSDERCMSILVILLPCLVCSSVYSVIRGVFWGNKDFAPYSLIELVEEIVMIIIGIILVSKMSSIFDGAKRAAFAISISYIVSFMLAIIVFFSKKEKLGNPKGYIKPLFLAAAPITGMRTISSLVNSLVAIILPLRLIASGLTKSEALAAFGMSFGMAIPILFIPSTIIGSVAVVLVPELAENYYRHHNSTLKRNIEKAIKFSVIVACTLAPILFVLGKDIGLLVYNDITSGVYISRISAVMLPMSLSLITTSMLNSINCEKKALIYYCFGAVVMLFSLWFLTGSFGSYSLGIGMFVSFSLTSFLNLRFLNKKSRVNLKYKKFTCFSIIFMLPSCVLGELSYSMLNVYFSTYLAAFLCMLIMLTISISLYAVFDMVNFKELKKYFKKD